MNDQLRQLMWIMRAGMVIIVLIAFKEPLYLSAGFVVFCQHEMLRRGW